MDDSYLWASAIVESSDDAIISKDLNSIITSWNPAAVRMFGYTAEEAIGMSIRRIIPEDRQGEEDEILARIKGQTDWLFSPFYRSSEARNLASGMGIGLAVCKRIIEAQKGEIWAKPRADGGAEFGFALATVPDVVEA